MSNGKKPFVDFRAIRARVTMEQVLEHYGVLGTFKRNGSRLLTLTIADCCHVWLLRVFVVR